MRLGLNIDLLRSQSGTGGEAGFEYEYQLILDRAQELGYQIPSALQQICQNELLKKLKSSGIWDKMDVFYLPATNGDADFASLNWKNPFVHQITRINSPVHIPNKGYKGDGASAYLNWNYNPTLDEENLDVGDASFGVYCFDAPTNQTGNVLISDSGTNNSERRIHLSANGAFNNYTAALNSSLITIKGNYSGDEGFYVITKQPSNNVIRGYGNGIQEGSAQRTDIAFRNGNVFSLRDSTTGTFSDEGIGLLFASSYLDTGEVQSFNTIVNDYLSCIAYDARYQQVIELAVSNGAGLPSPDVQEAGSTLRTELNDLGVWQNGRHFYVLMTDGDREFAKICWSDLTVASEIGTTMELIPGMGVQAVTTGAWRSQNDAQQATSAYAIIVTHGFTTNNRRWQGVIFNSAARITATHYNGQLYSGTSLQSGFSASPTGKTVRIYARSTVNYRSLKGTDYRTLTGAGSASNPNGKFGVVNAVSDAGGVSSGGDALMSFSGSMNVNINQAQMEGIRDAIDKYIDAVQFDSDYRTLINYARAMGYAVPTERVQAEQNAMLKRLKEAGIWDKLDTFYCVKGDGAAEFARLNWKAPGTYSLTENGTLTYFIYGGYEGNGTDGYLATTFNVATNSVNMTDSDAGHWFKVHIDVGAEGTDQPLLDASAGRFRMIPTTAATRYIVNVSGNNKNGAVDSEFSGDVSIVLQRKASNEIQLYRNGALVDTISDSFIQQSGVVNLLRSQGLGQYSDKIKLEVYGHGAAPEDDTMQATWDDIVKDYSNRINNFKPVNLTEPSISGTGTVGQTLTATAGTWLGETSVSGQWYSDDVAIAGATNLTYVLTVNEQGTNVTYKETATNSAGDTVAESNSIAIT